MWYESILQTLPSIVFYLVSFVALTSAIAMVAQPHPTYSAFAFVITLISLSAVFGLLGSTFIAALQIVVYAGAIMVLFIFVLMLLNVKAEEPHEVANPRLKIVSIGLVAVLVMQVGGVLIAASNGAIAPVFDASTIRVSRVLFEPRFIYVFEATSVLLLAAMVGAIAVAKRDP